MQLLFYETKAVTLPSNGTISLATAFPDLQHIYTEFKTVSSHVEKNCHLLVASILA
jgi:hypothetical protein